MNDEQTMTHLLTDENQCLLAAYKEAGVIMTFSIYPRAFTASPATGQMSEDDLFSKRYRLTLFAYQSKEAHEPIELPCDSEDPNETFRRASALIEKSNDSPLQILGVRQRMLNDGLTLPDA